MFSTMLFKNGKFGENSKEIVCIPKGISLLNKLMMKSTYKVYIRNFAETNTYIDTKLIKLKTLIAVISNK